MPERLDTVSDAESVARLALAEIAPEGTVGDLIASTPAEDGVLALNFVSTLSGYPGWHWSVSVAELADQAPTVLEAELMPGEGALLSPDWVPWVDRLEDYRLAQAAIAAADTGEGDDDDDDDLDDDEPDDDEPDDGDELDEHDDDLGDDPDDGIDFESDPHSSDEFDELGLPASGVDEQHEAEAESDDDGPEQPDES